MAKAKPRMKNASGEFGHRLFVFLKIWYMVWSRDSNALQTLKVMRPNIEVMT